MPEHLVLTSIDAPANMFQNGKHSHEVPLEQLIGPGVVIDVKSKAEKNAEYRVTKRDVQIWEQQHGRIPSGAIVIMNSGCGKMYPDSKLVYNTNNVSNVDLWRYPSWSLSAAEWLIQNRRIKALGVDTPAVDALSGATLPVHVRLLGDSLIALKGVANLDNLPPSGSTIFIPVIKIYGGSGGASRVFATVPKRY